MTGHRAIACLFGFGSVASAIAFVTLLFPGTVLDRLWLLNPEGYDGLLRWGPVGIVLMAIVCTVCTTILIGLWKGRPWGRTLAIVGLSINLVSDVLTAILRQRVVTLIGVPIALGLIVYLLRSQRVSSTAR